MDSDLNRHIGRYYGKYSGVVTDVDDPYKQGRVKIKIPAILYEEEIWARPCFPPGQFFVPPKDSYVWVEFEAGDIRSPLWVGVWYPQDTVPDLTKKNGADASVIQTSAGHIVEISDAKGKETIHVAHAKGKWDILISEQGDVEIKVAGDSKQIIEGKCQLQVQGAVEIQSSEEITIHGDASIKLGKDAREYIVIFDKFKQWWETYFKTVWSSHIHPTPYGPSGPTTAQLPSPEQTLVASEITKAQ